jgi:hypothetical protein
MARYIGHRKFFLAAPLLLGRSRRARSWRPPLSAISAAERHARSCQQDRRSRRSMRSKARSTLSDLAAGMRAAHEPRR